MFSPYCNCSVPSSPGIINHMFPLSLCSWNVWWTIIWYCPIRSNVMWESWLVMWPDVIIVLMLIVNCHGLKQVIGWWSHDLPDLKHVIGWWSHDLSDLKHVIGWWSYDWPDLKHVIGWWSHELSDLKHVIGWWSHDLPDLKQLMVTWPTWFGACDWLFPHRAGRQGGLYFTRMNWLITRLGRYVVCVCVCVCVCERERERERYTHKL